MPDRSTVPARVYCWAGGWDNQGWDDWRELGVRVEVMGIKIGGRGEKRGEWGG